MKEINIIYVLLYLLFFPAKVISDGLFWLEEISQIKILEVFSLAVNTFCACYLLKFGFHFYWSMDLADLITSCINLIMLINTLSISLYLISAIFCFLTEKKAGTLLLPEIGVDNDPSPHHKYTLGDQDCINNARSEYLQCAINPSGDCGDCKHREVEETTIKVDRTNKQAYMFAEVLKYMQGVDSFSVSCRKLGLEVQLFLEDGGRYKLTDLVDAWADEDFIYDWLKSLTKIQ
jgi:Family of unknown function (DUF6464)